MKVVHSLKVQRKMALLRKIEKEPSTAEGRVAKRLVHQLRLSMAKQSARRRKKK